MSKMARITVLVLAAAAFTLSSVACKSSGKSGSSSEHPKGEYPQKKTEQPKSDHPKH